MINGHRPWSTITLTGEGDTIIEALYDLRLNVEAAIERAKAANDDEEEPDL